MGGIALASVHAAAAVLDGREAELWEDCCLMGALALLLLCAGGGEPVWMVLASRRMLMRVIVQGRSGGICG
jgi:hypothetical protein